MKIRKAFWMWLSVIFAVPLVYILVALVVFDFTQTAFPYDEDNTPDGRPVALGPRPRWFACSRAHDSFNFEGREWPFVVFAPICSWWRSSHGYAPSAKWR